MPLNPRHLVDEPEQFGEVTIFAIGCLIVVDDLSQEVDLAVARVRRLTDLLDDFRRRTHSFMAPSVWDHTERTEIIAALDDRDVGPDGVMSDGETKRERHIVVGVDVELLGACVFSLGYERRQSTQRLCSDDDVDPWGAAENVLALLLGNATSDGDERLSIRRTLSAQRGQSSKKSVFGTFSDAACVDDDEICVFDVVRELVPSLLKEPSHALGVVNVHLATECFDARLSSHAVSPFAFRFLFSYFLCLLTSPGRRPLHQPNQHRSSVALVRSLYPLRPVPRSA